MCGMDQPDGFHISREIMDLMHKASKAENENLWQTISDAVVGLAEKLHAACIRICLDVPDGTLVPTGQHTEETLYLAGEAGAGERMGYDMGENGTFSVLIIPVKGYCWTGAERDAVQYLGENLFLLCSRMLMRKMLENAASLDRLTGAFNKQGMMRHGAALGEALADYVGISLNLKNFKYINSTIGQKSGDELLAAYCEALRKQLLPGETICRPGSDNYFLLVYKAHAEAYLKCLREVTVSIRSDSRPFTLYANAGVYDIQPGDDIETALDHSGIALQTVRTSGQAEEQLWYDPSMKEQVLHEKEISQMFPVALKNGEFVVYYQPKVSLEDQTLCGSEALVRWLHDGSVVPPMDFIPVLEKEGTVCQLDLYVLERVCQDLRHWLDNGIVPVRVSVNFSQQHLHNEALAEVIIGVLQKYSIDSSLIEVELTEMSGTRNYDAMLAFLEKMHTCGICTSIDDFGTGYSSLNMLREFHMDIIKLDKSFLDRITAENVDRRTDEIVIENIFRMAQALDLEIVSEGVETARQAEFLRRIHCDMAQGFLFDKPLPHDEYEQRLRGNRHYDLPEERSTSANGH